MLGYPAQAEERARQAVEDAAGTAYPVPLSVSLIWAVSVFLWTGNLVSAEEYLDRFVSHAESHSLCPILHSAAATEANWLFTGVIPGPGSRACRDAWKNSMRRVTRFWRRL